MAGQLAFWLYYAQRNPMPRRVRAFIDFVLEKLTDAGGFRLDAGELNVLTVAPAQVIEGNAAPGTQRQNKTGSPPARG